MNWFVASHAPIVLLFTGTTAYLVLRYWQRGDDRKTGNTGIDFRPSIGFTRLDGWSSLALLLENKSGSHVWVEEIEIILADLAANDQTSEASLHEIQKISQTVRSQDMLPVSLMETIYKAAGKPQRKYSCVMSSIVRYRSGEESFERTMRPYRLHLAGLTVISNHRERWAKSKFKPNNKAGDSQLVSTESK